MDNPNYNEEPAAVLESSPAAPFTPTLTDAKGQSETPQPSNQQQSPDQPANQTTNTPLGAWRFGLFDCFDDITVCAKAYFLPCIVTDEVAAHYGIGSNGEVCFWQALCCNFIPSLRERVRTEFSIPGDMIQDHIHGNLCAFCVLIQMRREIEAAKFMNYNQVNVPVIQRS